MVTGDPLLQRAPQPASKQQNSVSINLLVKTDVFV
jgi:hypothetical protein